MVRYYRRKTQSLNGLLFGHLLGSPHFFQLLTSTSISNYSKNNLNEGYLLDHYQISFSCINSMGIPSQLDIFCLKVSTNFR